MVQKFEYKRATMEDIDELVRTRIIVLRAANKLSDDEDMSVVEEESKAYYRRALETGEHIAYLVYDNGAPTTLSKPPRKDTFSHISLRAEMI